MQITEKIIKLKKEKNAVILAHCYQNLEIDEVADFVGDSLYLSIQAQNTKADIIVFAGVYFMAETAKLLNPEKKVLLPRKEAGCAMADMVNLTQLRDFKAQYPDVPVVCYINSTAEVKAECDICCTSSNAVEIVKSLNSDKVLFVPDENLGNYISSNLKGTQVITYPGFCPIHKNITLKDILNLKKEYPNALVLAHPECTAQTLTAADFTGSTTAIMEFAAKSESGQFIIATEQGVVERLKRDLPEKEFIIANSKAVCADMKYTTPEDILSALENEQHEITLNKETEIKARLTITKMLEVSEKTLVN